MKVLLHAFLIAFWFHVCMQALAKEALARWKEDIAVEKAKKQLAAAKKARLEAAAAKQAKLESSGARAKAKAKRPLENEEEAHDSKSVTWFDFETWQHHMPV